MASTTTNENGDLAARAGRLSAKLKDYARQLKAAVDARAAAEKERDEAKQTLESDPLKAENEQLKAQIRTDRHRTVFNEKAAAAGLSPEAVEDAWNLSGYKADTEVVDPTRIDTVLNEQKLKRPYLFAPIAVAEGEQPKPGPAKGRGGDVSTPVKFQVTRQQLRDPAWKASNKDAYNKAMSDKTIEFV